MRAPTAPHSSTAPCAPRRSPRPLLENPTFNHTQLRAPAPFKNHAWRLITNFVMAGCLELLLKKNKISFFQKGHWGAKGKFWV
jgi:hypothetical protein